jgi:hypothetical protein
MFVYKIALRSLRRRGLRNIAALAVALVVVQLLNMYGYATLQHAETLEELHALIPVTGYITSIGGNTEGLDIDEKTVAELEGSGFISEGVYLKAMPGLVGPFQEMERQSLRNAVHNSPPLVGTNSLASLPGLPSYADGYNDLLLDSGEPVCIVSENDLDFYGYSLGDSLLYTAVDLESGLNCSVVLLVGGTYKTPHRPASIYCPLAVVDSLQKKIDLPLTFSGASFRLQNTQELSRFRELLSELGFAAQMGSKESNGQLSFLIDDRQLKNATTDIQSYLDFAISLYPVIFFLLAGLGFVVSSLLIRLRKQEYAVMRSLGTSKGTTYLIFFTEQATTCLLGTALSLLLTMAVGHSLPLRQLAIVSGYIAFYLGGASVAILALNRSKVIYILSAIE